MSPQATYADITWLSWDNVRQILVSSALENAAVTNTNSVVIIIIIVVNITWSAGSTHGAEHIRIFHGDQTLSSTSTRAIFSFPICLGPDALINSLLALTDCAEQNGTTTPANPGSNK
ncbi:hypothetical protein FQN50_007818 [Emmonsiellopsis sp. PD_5]|nr:hypothetical protein FQN50_007818 [Emmonsiellopsis sp. PD_5]